MKTIKVCLVIICILLGISVCGNIFFDAGAGEGFTDVNIVRINGYSVYGSSVPVKID